MASFGDTRQKEWPMSFDGPMGATWQLQSLYLNFAETPPTVTEEWKCIVSAPAAAAPGPAAPPGGGGPASSPPGGGGPASSAAPPDGGGGGPGPSASLGGGGVLESGRQGGGPGPGSPAPYKWSLESGRQGGSPGPGPSAPLGGGGVLESGRQGGGPAASLKQAEPSEASEALQARYERRVQRRFGPSGPPWMQLKNEEDVARAELLAQWRHEDEVAFQARIQLEQEEDAARYEAKRDAKRARVGAVGVDIMAEDSGAREECDIAGRLDPGNDTLGFTPRETAPWVSHPDRLFEQMQETSIHT